MKPRPFLPTQNSPQCGQNFYRLLSAENRQEEAAPEPSPESQQEETMLKPVLENQQDEAVTEAV